MSQHLKQSQTNVGMTAWLALGGLLSIAVFRCLVVWSPEVGFLGDVVADPGPRTELDPFWLLALDALVLMFSSMAFLSSIVPVRRFDAWMFGLLMITTPFVVLHGVRDFASMWRGVDWLCVGVGGLALFRLCGHAHLRRVATGALLAATLPIALRGFLQVFYEHGLDTAFFERNRASVLESMGIEPGSNAAAIFERRARQAEATGWFGLANVYGSMMAFATLAWGGVIIAMVRNHVRSTVTAVAFVGGLMTMVALVLSGSKGAFGAFGLGAFVFVTFMLLRSREGHRPSRRNDWGGEHLRRLAGALVLVVMAMALGAVVVRGVVLDTTFSGEKSLLFRWHYLIGAWRMFVEHPVLGVGPGMFKEMYVQHRVPVSPEAVASAHSVLVDWVSMLGVGGLALGAWLVTLFYVAGRGLAGVTYEDETHDDVTTREGPAHASFEPPRALLYGVSIMGVLLPLVAESIVLLDPVVLVARLAGVLLFAVGAWALMSSSTESWWVCRWGLLGGVIAIGAQSQIEMTFFHAGSTMWMVFIVATLASYWRMRSMGARAGQWINRLTAGAPLAGLVVMVVLVLLPLGRQRWLMLDAVDGLRQLALISLKRGPGSAMQQDAVAHQLIEARRIAVEQLIDGYEVFPLNAQPLERAVTQTLVIATHEDTLPTYALATDRAERLVESHPALGSLALAVDAHVLRGRATGASASLARAVELQSQLVARDPMNPGAWFDYAELLWSLERRRPAREAYARALEASEQWWLDPLAQLQEDQLDRIHLRLKTDEPETE